MSASLRDLEKVKATLAEIVRSVNHQNDVINKMAMMFATMHQRVFPELYNEDGSMKPVKYVEENADNHQTDSQLVKLY